MLDLQTAPRSERTQPRDHLVLVVDDEPDIRELVGRILRRAGHQVLTADNGRTALAVMEQHNPDVIVLDLAMPLMGGLQLLDSLRPEIRRRVIVATGLAQEETAITCHQKGAGDFLAKPYSQADLLAVVTAHLNADSRK